MIVAVIPAKEESKRLANKNLLTINNKSLLTQAVEFAKSCHQIEKIYVTTDSDKVANEALPTGVEIIKRGIHLSGETPLFDVYQHAYQAINNPDIEYVVGIQTDHPDRTIRIENALAYVQDKNIDDLFTVDHNGFRNGSLRILSKSALNGEKHFYAASYPDPCTNIHTESDFLRACRVLSDSREIPIENKKIGFSAPVFVIAEAACNHMCQIDLAKQMIDKAVDAGADAIKFQTYTAEKLVTKNAVAFWGDEKISQLDYYRRLDRFGQKEYAELFDYAKDKGIICFSSPFDNENAKMLADLGMPLFKIASCDIPNLNFIQYIAEFQRPIILSTGASTIEEIQAAVDTIYRSGNFQLVLLACTLSYPTQAQDANLLRIQKLKSLYPELVIGLSDHTEPDANMIIPSIAVALGAKVIEKHYTLDRSMTGSGHFFAVDPSDLKKMIYNIRTAETLFGSGELGVSPAEKEAWKSARRAIVANIPIAKGTRIEAHMLGLKRPAIGLSPEETINIIGKTALVDIDADTFLTMEMVG